MPAAGLRLADGSTIVTADHARRQQEHTVLVTEQGYEVLTPAGASGPATAAAA
jgi:hypothetical protein